MLLNNNNFVWLMHMIIPLNVDYQNFTWMCVLYYFIFLLVISFIFLAKRFVQSMIYISILVYKQQANPFLHKMVLQMMLFLFVNTYRCIYCDLFELDHPNRPIKLLKCLKLRNARRNTEYLLHKCHFHLLGCLHTT